MELKKQSGSGMSKIILPYCEKEESDIMSATSFSVLKKALFFLLGNVGHYQSLAFQAYRGQKKKS